MVPERLELTSRVNSISPSCACVIPSPPLSYRYTHCLSVPRPRSLLKARSSDACPRRRGPSSRGSASSRAAARRTQTGTRFAPANRGVFSDTRLTRLYAVSLARQRSCAAAGAAIDPSPLSAMTSRCSPSRVRVRFLLRRPSGSPSHFSPYHRQRHAMLAE